MLAVVSAGEEETASIVDLVEVALVEVLIFVDDFEEGLHDEVIQVQLTRHLVHDLHLLLAGDDLAWTQDGGNAGVGLRERNDQEVDDVIVHEREANQHVTERLLKAHLVDADHS